MYGLRDTAFCSSSPVYDGTIPADFKRTYVLIPWERADRDLVRARNQIEGDLKSAESDQGEAAISWNRQNNLAICSTITTVGNTSRYLMCLTKGKCCV